MHPISRPLVLACLLLSFAGSAWADEKKEAAAAAIAPTEWLVIGPLDRRARRPFNPDAVFARYLLDPKSGVPHEGDTLTGERGDEQTWTKATLDEKGRIGGRISYAYARLEMPKAEVRMARLHGGARLYVNGVGSVGDIYAGRFGGFPIALKKGVNHLFVRGVRGSFKLALETPPAPLFVAPWSSSLPDFVVGESIDTQAGLILVNASTDTVLQALVVTDGSDLLEPSTSASVDGLPPLCTVQVRLPLKSKPGQTVPADVEAIEVPLTISGVHRPPAAAGTVKLKVQKSTDALLRTFVSDIDDSVQFYGLRRPAVREEDDTRPLGLVLSLHGAGVQPRGQANAYAAKSDFWIVAPTNRRRFGFDWQDWGRQDAYEVLADALALSGVDRRRVYLTGHSMGGHGAWHLAANDPDGFAAVAPSAGWVSFDTYGGGRPDGELADLWKAADGASDTLDLIDNLKQVPTYILHGEKDDNVPLREALTMAKALREVGASFAMHVEPGKKHWWDGYEEPGAQCVDWPGIFDLFREQRIRERPNHIQFRGVDPGIDSRHHWIEVLQPSTYGVPFEIMARYQPERRILIVGTKNVQTFALRMPGDPFRRIVVDGEDVPVLHPLLSRGRPDAQGVWRPGIQPQPGKVKTPDSCGPFKRAFDRGFVFVYGTQGSREETAALFSRARFDAQMWCYRANGQSRVLADEHYLSRRALGRFKGRNAILYGNADTNAAFEVVDRGCPVKTFRGGIRVGSRTWVGEDLAACFVTPQERGEGALVGVFADSGIAGTRLGYTHMAFVSGAGYPDYVVYDPRVLTKGDRGVLAAGWFSHGWGLQDGGYRRAEEEVNPDPPK